MRAGEKKKCMLGLLVTAEGGDEAVGWYAGNGRTGSLKRRTAVLCRENGRAGRSRCTLGPKKRHGLLFRTGLVYRQHNFEDHPKAIHNVGARRIPLVPREVNNRSAAVIARRRYSQAVWAALAGPDEWFREPNGQEPGAVAPAPTPQVCHRMSHNE